MIMSSENSQFFLLDVAASALEFSYSVSSCPTPNALICFAVFPTPDVLLVIILLVKIIKLI